MRRVAGLLLFVAVAVMGLGLILRLGLGPGLFAADGPDGPAYLEYWEGLGCPSLDPASYPVGSVYDCDPSASIDGTISGRMVVGRIQQQYFSGSIYSGLHTYVPAADSVDYASENLVCAAFDTDADGVGDEIATVGDTGPWAPGSDHGNFYSVGQWTGGVEVANHPLIAVYTIPASPGYVWQCDTYNLGVVPDFVAGQGGDVGNADTLGTGCSGLDMGCWLSYLFVPTVTFDDVLAEYETTFPFSVIADVSDAGVQVVSLISNGTDNAFACDAPSFGFSTPLWGGFGAELPLPPDECGPSGSDLVDTAGSLFGLRVPIRAALAIALYLGVLVRMLGVFGWRTGLEPMGGDE